MVQVPEMPKAQGPIGFCTFKASRWQLDVVQPQFTTTTYLSSCVIRVYLLLAYIINTPVTWSNTTAAIHHLCKMIAEGGYYLRATFIAM